MRDVPWQTLAASLPLDLWLTCSGLILWRTLGVALASSLGSPRSLTMLVLPGLWLLWCMLGVVLLVVGRGVFPAGGKVVDVSWSRCLSLSGIDFVGGMFFGLFRLRW